MSLLNRRSRPAVAAAGPSRSKPYREAAHDRFWWHQLTDTDYVPAIYATLSDEQWSVMNAWYEETERKQYIGEINVPAMSFIQGLVMGNGVTRIVQLGHYFGYSSMLLGMWLKAMDARPGLVTIDIDQGASDFTQEWVGRAGASEHVSVFTGDSASNEAVAAADAFLGPKGPQLILLDSSHAYQHTMRELALWGPRLAVGAILLLHDTSRFAQQFDSAGEGGVQRALDEWLPQHPEFAAINLNSFVEEGQDGNALVYKDGCGLGIVQRVA